MTAGPGRRVLTQAQMDDFLADGHLRLGKILDDQQLALLRGEYDREIEQARVRGNLGDLASADDRPEAERDQLLEVFDVHTRNAVFLRLIHLGTVLDVVEDLIGPNIRLLGAHLLYKPAGHGSVVHWHQDNTSHQCVPPSMVSAWLTLDDVDRDNGAMQMIPGSHLRPSWEDWRENVEGLDTSRATVIDLPAGGMMMHHCQALHHTGPNRSDRPRRAVVMRFVSLGTRSPHLRTEAWEFFFNPILRMRI